MAVCTIALGGHGWWSVVGSLGTDLVIWCEIRLLAKWVWDFSWVMIFFFGSDGGVEWLYVVCSGWVFFSGKQSVVKDFIFYFWKNWMDRFSLIPKLKQYNQEKNKGTRTLQDNPKNQHLRDVWNQHQAIKLRHQYLRCQHPTIWKIFHLKFH